MNKQEAIEKINNITARETFMSEIIWVKRDEVLDIIKQIDEPEKPVIPKFVAEWIDYCKREGKVLQTALNNSPDDVHNWLHDGSDNMSFDTFAHAWIGGYHKEDPLYFVRTKRGSSLLAHDTKGNVIENYGWSKTVQRNEIEKFSFTEQEIKDFDERYFAFAVPVEVE